MEPPSARPRRPRWPAIATAAALVAACGAAIPWWQHQASTARVAPFQRGEIALQVIAPPSAEVVLCRAGSDLDTATCEPAMAGQRWLAPDSYFVEVKRDGASSWYPVPLSDQMRGPDGHGTFTVTSRPVVSGVPPAFDGESSRHVLVPSGNSALGDARNPGASHFVYVTAFYIDACEVTNAEFRRFMDDPRGYERRESWTAEGWAWKQRGDATATSRLAMAEASDPRFSGDDHPVVLVNWFEANAYARWLTGRLGGGRWLFRLPTDAEWEKAARGPDGFAYGLGTSLSEPESPLYNWRKNPGAETTVAGVAESRRRYRPNRYGMYHASGNVAEWTQSVSRPYSRTRPYRDDDRNLDATSGPRTTRGGSWYSATASRLQSAYREEFQPELRSNDLGFRLVALPLPGGPPPKR